MSVNKVAQRAVTVAERLLRHGRESVTIEITRQGRTRKDSDRLGTALQISMDPYTAVEALELLADKLDMEAARDAIGGHGEVVQA